MFEPPSASVEIDWAAEAVRLRREENMPTADIAQRVDRSPSRVRRVLAEANTDRAMNGRGDIPGQTTVDDHLPPEDDPEHPDTLAEFRGEAGEPVGPMPPSRAVDPQDGFFDVTWDDERLLAVLEEREKTREAKLTASKAHKLKDDEAKALLGGYSLAVGEVARIGRFRIKKTRREGSDVSFTTEPREQLQIAVDSGE